MHPRVAQLALIDTLLANWDGIEVRLGPGDASLRAQLAAIAQRLVAARSPDEIALAIDDLLDVVLGTPAETFVRALMRRASISDAQGRVRSEAAAAAVNSAYVAIADDAARAGTRRLAQAIAAVPDHTVVPAFFVTNRQRRSGGVLSADAFTGDVAESLSYGVAQVTIPVAHRPGRVETPRWWMPWADPGRTDRYVVIRDLEPLDPAAFATRLESAAEGGARDLLVFMHGYNVTFEQAARRAAQLAFDLDFRGIVLLFSWPSTGRTFGYAADEERAMTSAEPLAELLAMLAGGPWRSVHLLAHSMGNRVLTFALADHRPAAFVPGEIVFVAADVYVALFMQKLARLRAAAAGRMTLYASRDDRALLLSQLLHAAERIGHIRAGQPFVAEGIETIDASNVDTGILGHSYFSDRPVLLEDVSTLLTRRVRAADRTSVEEAGRYWVFPPS